MTVPHDEHSPGAPRPARAGDNLPFRTRLALSLLAAALLPVLAFGAIAALAVLASDRALDPTLGRVLLFGMAVVVILGIAFSYVLASELVRPLRSIVDAVDRIAEGRLASPIEFPGDDELARLADSHNRLANDLARRDAELARILAAIAALSPRDGADLLAAQASSDAQAAFGMIDAIVLLGDPNRVPEQEVIPGETRPLRAVLRAGGDDLGVLIGKVSATRPWARADQDLLDLFASEVAVAIRNAQLFATVAAQNERLIELDSAKDDFLRGVSHNLQTPLTSIRAYAEQLSTQHPDRRLGIIAEQSERLSRMVRQLLTVSRLDSGVLRPRLEVTSPASRVRRTWEALGTDTAFSLTDTSAGWLAIADADHLDQVLWALLDNAVKHGAGTPVGVVVSAVPSESLVTIAIRDRGPGVDSEDSARLFTRFARGADREKDGTGLGLYVSRELCRAMGGDLELARPADGTGATFVIRLPGEAADAP